MTLKKCAYLFNLFAALVTLDIGFVSMESFSLARLLFLFLTIVPYALMAYVIKRSENNLSILVNAWLSIFLTLLGTATLIYEIFMHKDAQSAMAFVVIPVYQLCVFAVVSFSVYVVVRKRPAQ